MRELSAEIKRLESELGEVERRPRRARADAAQPSRARRRPTARPTRTPSSLREVGERPSFDFEIRDHVELGAEHGLIDIERAARVSGARFAYLMGDLVIVELALVR